MSKEEHDKIFYDPMNEIVCDRFALEKLVKESEEKDKTISDLEAKLAESEKENKDLEDDHNKLIEQYNNQYNDLCKEIKFHSSARERFVERVKELEQQLAEKDEIIDWQNEIIEGVKQEEELLAQKLKSLGVDCIEDLGKEINQDKISLAVEQLEKVKEKINDCPITDYDTNKHFVKMYQRDAIRQLDNQIEELKKEIK